MDRVRSLSEHSRRHKGQHILTLETNKYQKIDSFISDFMAGSSEKLSWEEIGKIIDDANRRSWLFKVIESVEKRLTALKEARRK